MATSDRVKPALGGTVEYLPFEALPLHDSTWGLCTGRDGNIYIAACGEITGGLSVFLLRYRPVERKLEYLLEVGPAVGEPPDNGHATQSKIHYCLIPGSDGLLYCATHASGPPLNHPIWRPWNCWDDPIRGFPGAYLFTYNPETGELVNFGIGPRKEGSRALAFDEKRRTFYGITWPRNHVYVYRLDERRYLDLGRIGDINPQAIWLDRDGNAYTTDDYGRILRIDAATLDIRALAAVCPREGYRRGWHNVPYDVVPSPDWEWFYGTDWGFESRLWRFSPYAGPDGVMEDLGRAWGPDDPPSDRHLEFWQARGLVFGADGKLYYCKRCGAGDSAEQTMLRYEPGTGRHEQVCVLRFGEHRPVAIASATQDYHGNLYFADAGVAPTGMHIYRPDGTSTKRTVFSWKDIKQWG